MPRTEVRAFRTADGKVPLLKWLDALPRTVRVKCNAHIRRLAELGHELRRPYADLLRDGIYELRIRRGRVNYRVLYFFHGRQAVVLSHGTTKERRVAEKDIEQALRSKAQYLTDPDRYAVRILEVDGP